MKEPLDLLQSNLLDLLYQLRESNVPLIVGGGYGLHLKRRELQRTDARHLLPLVPQERSTEDLDLFLTTQILVDPKKAKTVLEAVQTLQFNPVKDKENFQFTKDFQLEEQLFRIKLDFLTRVPEDSILLHSLDVQGVRVRNRKSGGIHARRTDEAIAVEDNLVPIILTGLRTTGEEFSGQVYLPQAYAYLMMKLFAFRDWEIKKQNPGYSRKHALDIYSIIAMLTEEELAGTDDAARHYRQRPAARESARIAHDFFFQPTSLGNLRLREHQSFSRDMNLTEFISILSELFPNHTQ